MECLGDSCLVFIIHEHNLQMKYKLIREVSSTIDPDYHRHAGVSQKFLQRDNKMMVSDSVTIELED